MSVLYVVATPIGNLGDLAPRAREALAGADLICAEDTRVTMKLLNFIDARKQSISLNRHNEESKLEGVIERMTAEDISVCLVTDAGTPAISDPGNLLVDAAWRAGIAVVPVCGPSACVAAISASGFDAREFAFFGFLPREKKALEDKLRAILKTGVPVFACHESPHRVKELLAAIERALPDARVLAACDISKKFELLLRGETRCVLEKIENNPNSEKGEYTIVADISRTPQPPEIAPGKTCCEFMLGELLAGAELNAAADAASQKYSRNEVYKAKLALKELIY